MPMSPASPYMAAMMPGGPGGMSTPVLMCPVPGPWGMAAYPQQWPGGPVYGFYPAPYGVSGSM
jgi:hypothetical protein